MSATGANREGRRTRARLAMKKLGRGGAMNGETGRLPNEVRCWSIYTG
jgi:hypothetical protein